MNDKGSPPKLEQPAPGLVWRKRLKVNEWVATWLARTDIIKRGYSPRSIELWSGAVLDEKQAADIAQRCQHQQFDMLTWGRELPPPEKPLPDYFTGDRALAIPSTEQAPPPVSWLEAKAEINAGWPDDGSYTDDPRLAASIPSPHPAGGK